MSDSITAVSSGHRWSVAPGDALFISRKGDPGTAERLTSDQLARVRRAYAVPAAPGVTVAQASPRLLQPCLRRPVQTRLQIRPGQAKVTT